MSERREPSLRAHDLSGASGALVIRRVHEADAVVLALSGELDLSSAQALSRELIDAEASGRVVVDLSGLKFMDSTGLHTLLSAQRRYEQSGSRLSLLRGPPQVQRVFELTVTERAFTFDD